MIRDQYDVYFGNSQIASGCGTGLTLWMDPTNHIDPGNDAPVLAKELRRITLLSFSDTSVSDAALEHLRGMNSVHSLILDRTRVVGPGLVHLQEMPLQLLTLHGTDIDDNGLEYLPTFPELRVLDLGATRVTGPGLTNLHKFSELTSLDLSDTRITDDVVRTLVPLQLSSLDLHNTPITGAAIDYLEKMPQLSSVHLCGTKVTKEAAKASKSAAVRGWVTLSEALCDHSGKRGMHGSY